MHLINTRFLSFARAEFIEVYERLKVASVRMLEFFEM